ncbi:MULTISPECIES: transporter substrate-binding domain-containing protein [unclassified Psychrobacillus]|uniref:transporter substrate-binding domain-containing protein n=1 Tax=unclassified Psychrobacillus TaxID=2636677 RepID=UPI00146B7B2C|nr:transporter substrate-binding domain-containing protein [Psychrobacillus sp. BL-248-WT-3]NME06514.1 transporter substrate-binding domain-containing protein [Psychrobacillus sp. BL-248-WT-3]
MKNKLFLIMLTMIIALLAACGTKDDAKEDAGSGSTPSEELPVLKMGTSADYPPFEFIDPTKSEEIIGFDIDLSNLIAEKLGYKIEVENIDFNGLIPAIQAGKLDFVLAGMSPTEERDEVVDFSIPYNETVQMVVTKKDSGIKTVEDLAGKTVGVQISSVQEELANELAETVDMKVESRNLIPEVIQELMTKRFDAAVIEDVVAENYTQRNKDLTYFPIVVEEIDTKAAVFPEGSELKEKFDKAINELIEEGKIDELREKWFVVEAE